MDGSWQGFTANDINFYKRKSGFYEKNNDNVFQTVLENNLISAGTEGRKKLKAKRFSNYKLLNAKVNMSDIADNAKLCKNSEKLESPSIKVKNNAERETLMNNEPKTKEKEICGPETNLHHTGSSNPVCLKIIEGKAYELIDKNSMDDSKTNLEICETRQKKLEEENKKKKEMLAKVISDRKKQTSEEAKRLQHIQEELQKLDERLTNDVGILRDQIEAASLDFAEAQKRYSKAEKEFVVAKQNLIGKLEAKELLTKYLCTIIEQNEMRKAQKLSELMEKLEIKENGMVDMVAKNDSKSALNESDKSTKIVKQTS